MAVIQKIVNGVTFNECDSNQNWKLIYNNISVIDLSNDSGIIKTQSNIFEGATQDDCFSKIDELRITYYHQLNDDEMLVFSGGTRTVINIEDLEQ